MAVAVAVAGLLCAAEPARGETLCTATIDSFGFGSIAITSPELLNGSVTINCTTLPIVIGLTVTVNYCISVGNGDGGSGALFVPRRMNNGHGDSLAFNLFHGAGYSTVVGSRTVPGTTPITGTMTYLGLAGLFSYGSATHPVQARIPAQSDAAVGSYSSDFGGNHTALAYRYSDVLLTPAPSSCTSGGNGGETGVRAPFLVSATVEPVCEIAAADDMDFGTTPGVIDAPLMATSAITMTCRRDTAWQMSLNDGDHAVGQTRRMARAGGGNVTYELYRDPARTQRFGQTEGVDRQVGSGTGSSESVLVYGKIPAPQSVAPGSYSDRVIVTVTY